MEVSQAVRLATEIKLRAERKAGEILKETPKNEGVTLNGKDSVGSPLVEPPKSTPTLADLGVTKKESSRYQKLASTPAEE